MCREANSVQRMHSRSALRILRPNATPLTSISRIHASSFVLTASSPLCQGRWGLGETTPRWFLKIIPTPDIRNMKLNDEICPTLQAKSNGGHSLNYTPPVIQPVYIDRAAFNQKNALYDPQFVENMATTLVAKGPGALCHENVPVAYSVGNGQLNQTGGTHRKAIGYHA